MNRKEYEKRLIAEKIVCEIQFYQMGYSFKEINKDGKITATTPKEKVKIRQDQRNKLIEIVLKNL